MSIGYRMPWQRAGRCRYMGQVWDEGGWPLGSIVVLCLLSLTVQAFGQVSPDVSSPAPAAQSTPGAPSEEQRQKAIKQFLEAVAITKNNLGATYYMNGLYDSAMVHLRDVLKIAPDFAAAHLTLGLVYYALGKREDAILSFKSAAVGDIVGQRRMGLVHPDTVHVWAQNQFSSMVQGNPSLAEAHTTLAMVYDQGGYVQDAERHYRQAIERDSTHVNAYTNLGKLYTNTERFDEAIHLYEKALLLGLNDEEQAKVHLNIGVSYMGLKKTDEAIQVWRKAVELYPAYAEAYMNLGIAYQTGNMADSAKASWERALGVDAEFLAPRVALARLAVGDSRYNDAIDHYKGILDTGARDPRIYAELAFAYERLDDDDQAISYYEESLKLDPESSEIRSVLELVKKRRQQHREARQANKIRLRQIVVKQKAEAEQILVQLRGGMDFAELARLKSIDPSSNNGGDIGFFGPGEMIPAFEEAAMALKVGGISGIIETPMGFHIIKRIE